MAYRIFVDPAHRVGTVVAYAGFNGAEMTEAMRRLYESVDWQPGYSALWNTQRVHALVFDPKDIEDITALALKTAPRMGQGKAAFVVADKLHHMITSLLIIKTSVAGRERRLFRTLPPALAWLGLPADYLVARNLD